MLKLDARTFACVLVAGTVAGCTEVPSDTKPNSTPVVQIGSVAVDSLNIHCTDPQGGQEQVYHANFSIEMVNTTASDVNVVSVASHGQIFQSTVPGEAGTPAQTFASLPFTPSPATVRAHDGDVTVRASMTGLCGTATITDTLTRIIVTTVVVTTNSGQYATAPIAFNGTWTHAELISGLRRR